eukprot:2605364-Prymnesium_polylepis.1
MRIARRPRVPWRGGRPSDSRLSRRPPGARTRLLRMSQSHESPTRLGAKGPAVLEPSSPAACPLA